MSSTVYKNLMHVIFYAFNTLSTDTKQTNVNNHITSKFSQVSMFRIVPTGNPAETDICCYINTEELTYRW